jgi:hypothetical protein
MFDGRVAHQDPHCHAKRGILNLPLPGLQSRWPPE